MKKGYVKLLMISFVILSVLVINSVSNFFNLYTYALFLLFMFFITKKLVGYERDIFRDKKAIIIMIVCGLLLYYTLTYSTVFFVGVLVNRMTLTIGNIINTIIPIVLIIVFTELLRYVMMRKAKKYISLWLLFIILFTLIDIALKTRGYDFAHGAHLLRFSVEIIAPSLAKNIFLCYLVYKAGYKPAIIFRLLFDLPLYILPIFPNLGPFIDSSIKIIFPNILLFILVFRYSNKVNMASEKKNNILGKVSVVVITIIMILSVALFSTKFTYYAMVVGSASMEPALSTGDIVIARRVDDISRLSVGDTLIFKAEDTTVIHRINRIEENNGHYYFFTKGDNNESEDFYPVTQGQILGVAIFRIRYLGYPTVWLNNQLNTNVGEVE